MITQPQPFGLLFCLLNISWFRYILITKERAAEPTAKPAAERSALMYIVTYP